MNVSANRHKWCRIFNVLAMICLISDNFGMRIIENNRIIIKCLDLFNYNAM